MMEKNERLEILEIIGQVTVLSLGFALVYSWEADFQPRLLALFILILLVLIYPMTGRLNNNAEKNMIELQKAIGFTQYLIFLEVSGLKTGTFEDDHLTTEEKLRKAQEFADQFENLRLGYEESFEKGSHLERERSGTDRLNFLVRSYSVAIYLFVLIAISAIIGWFIFVLF